MNRIYLFAFSIVSFLFLSAQKPFEGKIVYNITYSAISPDMEGFESFLPTQNILYVQGKKVRTEVPMPFGDPQITVLDSENQSGFMTKDLFGNKLAITYNKDIVVAEDERDIEESFAYFDDYKFILGYKCQKAVITTTIDGVSSSETYYFTEELPNLNTEVEGLKGMSLEYTSNVEGTTSTVTAISITKEKIGDSFFDIPEGYEAIATDQVEDHPLFQTSEE